METPATIVYVLGAIQDFLPDWRKYGFGIASRLFRFRISKPWLSHLATDKYLSAQQFKAVYGSHFPNSYFTKVGCFMGMIWES